MTVPKTVYLVHLDGDITGVNETVQWGFTDETDADTVRQLLNAECGPAWDESQPIAYSLWEPELMGFLAERTDLTVEQVTEKMLAIRKEAGW